MSYDVHITKAEHWIYSEKNPIAVEDIEKVSDLLDTFKGVPFQYKDGRLMISSADERVIGLMIDIANRIDVRVQGDDGEYYNNDENKYPQPPEYLKQDLNEPEVDILDEKKQFVESLGINKKILHPKYGTGKIIEILGEGMDTELVVKFTDKEKTTRLLAYYAPISF
ncbi:hypothetical protein [Paenibacillus luteus]|uniref:hypothetical protein n=1 Tax=Paenibacillus luteus TaxID=2545753 RepID=UPI001142F0ED|nr:hypothetical protein [Paenibacillus luteus]